MAKGTCLFEDCDRVTVARGLCRSHYEKAGREGRREQFPKKELARRHIADTGYVMVWDPDHSRALPYGYVAEHRKVVHDAGIAIPTGHYVHHKNGVKTDNRLENLEVKPADQHAREHVLEQGYARNQFGTYPLSTSDEERRERRRVNNAASAERRKQMRVARRRESA